jgi:hypothetical protein
MDKLIQALNAVQPQVWSVFQFVALIGLVIYGGHLLVKGQTAEGSGLVAGAFALLKFEVGGKSNS